MANSEEQPPDALAEAIVDYLAEHPDAADSLIGIRQWWLAGDFVDISDAEMRRTLERLLAAGRIGRTRLADGTEVYSSPRPRRRQ